MVDMQTWFGIQQLYADYAIAVDSGQWDQWPEFFTEQCVYKVQPRENHERGFPLATLALTSKGMLKDRVYGITETIYHDPYQTPEGLKFAERICVYDSEMIPNSIIYPI